jgi:predicted nuclease with TOPRIM domain
MEMDNRKQMIQELLGGMEERTNAKAAKQEEMLFEMNAKMDANMTKMAAIWSELEEFMECQTKHLMMAMWNTNPEAMKIEQSVEEHQDVPSEDVIVRPED